MLRIVSSIKKRSRRQWILTLACAIFLSVVALETARATEPCGHCRPGLFSWFRTNWHQPAIPPAPQGSFVRRFMDVQATKAEASDFVVYLDEWYRAGDKLGPYGDYHLNQVANRISTVPFPVIVEPTHDGALNEKRRQLVVTRLSNLGVQDANVRVVIGHAQSEDMRSEDIERAFANYTIQQNGNNFTAGFPFGNRGFGWGGGLGGWGGGFGGWGGGFGGWGGGFGGFGARPLIYGY